ncbi:MAG: hypothetical protein DCC50_02920 [Acidobacteria bacterium]|nr:MAG: hypothetical protein DCC50_02920 [Acidobacteriota bacterium]
MAVLAVVAVAMRSAGEPEGLPRALEVAPAQTTQITYVNRDAWAERVGVEGIEGDASEEERLRYLQESDAGAVSTPLAAFAAGAQDAPFGELDVDWWMSGVDGAGVAWEVYRLDDDVDLGDVADELAGAGYARADLRGHDRLTIEDAGEDPGALGQAWPPQMQDLTLLEDEHLVVVGASPEQVVDVVDGDADAASGSEGFEQLTQGLSGAEFAVLRGGVADCTATGHLQQSAAGRLETVARLVLASHEAAQQDAQARQTWLRQGQDPVSRQPMQELFDPESVEADGHVVTVRGTFKEPRTGPEMAMRDVLTACELPSR